MYVYIYSAIDILAPTHIYTLSPICGYVTIYNTVNITAQTHIYTLSTVCGCKLMYPIYSAIYIYITEQTHIYTLTTICLCTPMYAIYSDVDVRAPAHIDTLSIVYGSALMYAIIYRHAHLSILVL